MGKDFIDPFDPVSSLGLPSADGGQPNDGGLTVALMNDLAVVLTHRASGQALRFDNVFLAIDVGQRLIQMGTESLRRQMEGNTPTVKAPKLDIVSIQARLPKDFGG